MNHPPFTLLPRGCEGYCAEVLTGWLPGHIAPVIVDV